MTISNVSGASSFAQSGVPRATGQPDWKSYGSEGACMHLTDRPRMASSILSDMYRLNEEVVRRRRLHGDVSWNWNVGVAAPPEKSPDADS